MGTIRVAIPTEISQSAGNGDARRFVLAASSGDPGIPASELLLPEEQAGLLVVRSKRLDFATMAGVCAAVVYIAFTIDPLGTS